MAGVNYHKGHVACSTEARRRLAKNRRRADKQWLNTVVVVKKRKRSK